MALTAVLLKIQVLWNVLTCRLVNSCHRFDVAPSCSGPKSLKNGLRRKIRATLLKILDCEATKQRFFETSVLYFRVYTRWTSQETSNLQPQRAFRHSNCNFQHTVPYSIERCRHAPRQLWNNDQTKRRSAFPSANHCQGQLQTPQSATVHLTAVPYFTSLIVKWRNHCIYEE